MTQGITRYASLFGLLLGAFGCADVEGVGSDAELHSSPVARLEAGNAIAPEATKEPTCRVMIPEPEFLGCRGAADRVCSELVNPSYLASHPTCTKNTLSCESSYYDCDVNLCPEPVDGDHYYQAPMGKEFAPGEVIYSPDRAFRLAWQADGNLVLYRNSDGAPIWNTGTTRRGRSPRLVFQTDGNLVIYATYSFFGTIPIWASGTHVGTHPLVLEVNDDRGTGSSVTIRPRVMGLCDLVDHSPIWKSN